MIISYFNVIKSNYAFRLLWIAQMISYIGDWFNTVALMDYVSNPINIPKGEQGILISVVLICSYLPQFIMGPIAGVVVDRINRKTVLIVSDVLRGILVLGYLFISPNTLWIIFLIEVTVFSIASFFLSAKAAMIPNITKSASELINANALSQTTWGLMLIVGALLAGVVVSNFGFHFAVVFNSMTFLLSSYFVWKIHYEEPGQTEESVKDISDNKSIFKKTWNDIITGLSYIKNDRYITALILIKPGWAIGGGAVLVLHIVFAKEVFFGGSDGIGIMYMSRGLGVLLGSFLGQWMFRKYKHINVMWQLMAMFVLYGIFYGGFSQMPSLFWGSMMLVLATLFSSNLWMFSRIALQNIVPNELRGRIFAHDEGLSTLFFMFSAVIAGWLIDLHINPRYIALSSAIIMILCGIMIFIGLSTRYLPDREGKSTQTSMP